MPKLVKHNLEILFYYLVHSFVWPLRTTLFKHIFVTLLDEDLGIKLAQHQ